MKPHIKLRIRPADGFAVKAWAAGEATPDQQQRAYEVVMALAGMRDEPFDADNARLTDYRLGRQSVGRDIVGILSSRIPTRRQVPLKEQESES